MIIDIIFAGVISYGLYVGFTNGIIKTIFTVLSIAVGFLITAHFHETVTQLLVEVSNYHNPIMTFVGMGATFFFTMLFLRLIGRQLENILKMANINFLNQILGGVVMSVLFAVIYSLIINFMVEARLLKEQTADSKTYPILQEIPQHANRVYVQFSPKVKELWDEMAIALDKMGEKSSDIKVRQLEDDETKGIFEE